MGENHKRFAVRFYRADSGNEPARKWLKDLEPADRKIIGDDLRTFEFGWPVGNAVMPLLELSQWIVGSPEQFGRRTNCKSFVLCQKRRVNSIAWIYKENAENTGSGNFYSC